MLQIIQIFYFKIKRSRLYFGLYIPLQLFQNYPSFTDIFTVNSVLFYNGNGPPDSDGRNALFQVSVEGRGAHADSKIFQVSPIFISSTSTPIQNCISSLT